MIDDPIIQNLKLEPIAGASLFRFTYDHKAKAGGGSVFIPLSELRLLIEDAQKYLTSPNVYVAPTKPSFIDWLRKLYDSDDAR